MVALVVEVCRAQEYRGVSGGGKSYVRKMKRRQQQQLGGAKMNHVAADGSVDAVAFDSAVVAVGGECVANVAFDCAVEFKRG